MIRSIFTRDKPGTSDPAVAGALADAELQFGMTAIPPVVDPLRVKAPVLVVRGEHDGIATEEDLLDFFHRLPNPDRQFIILAGASHAVALGLSRSQLWHVVREFLTIPGA
jgi:alpha-beta hydrolase superfamily lysophospholipase